MKTQEWFSPEISIFIMSFDRACALLSAARSVTVLTGAGISAESGVPTFRGATGLWRQFHPEDLATPEAFFRDPKLVWEWYDWRRGLIAAAQPNDGHSALSKLEKLFPGFTVITQNVDGLHQRGGSTSVLEIHGNIWTLRCTRCKREWQDNTVPLAIPPYCGCGGLARPGVIWFGEELPRVIWQVAEEATTSCEVLLVVGTSAVVYPAAGLARLAAFQGARIVEVNLEPTSISGIVDCVLTGPAGEILPQLTECVAAKR